MERMLVVGSVTSGLGYALAGDRHYEGIQAPDGTDISSRTKHREYMKAKGLTTADDYTGTWNKEFKERQERRLGQHEDKGLRKTLERELHRRTQ